MWPWTIVAWAKSSDFFASASNGARLTSPSARRYRPRWSRGSSVGHSDQYRLPRSGASLTHWAPGSTPSCAGRAPIWAVSLMRAMRQCTRSWPVCSEASTTGNSSLKSHSRSTVNAGSSISWLGTEPEGCSSSSSSRPRSSRCRAFSAPWIGGSASPVRSPSGSVGGPPQPAPGSSLRTAEPIAEPSRPTRVSCEPGCHLTAGASGPGSAIRRNASTPSVSCQIVIGRRLGATSRPLDGFGHRSSRLMERETSRWSRSEVRRVPPLGAIVLGDRPKRHSGTICQEMIAQPNESPGRRPGGFASTDRFTQSLAGRFTQSAVSLLGALVLATLAGTSRSRGLSSDRGGPLRPTGPALPAG